MKLWEAILIGCDRRAQGFDGLFKHYEDGRVESCALGAAYESTFNRLGGDDTEDEYGTLEEVYPVLSVEKDGEKIIDIIINLNDTEEWSRERIALEFVKPIEDPKDSPSADPS